jgi:hypothetical protein
MHGYSRKGSGSTEGSWPRGETTGEYPYHKKKPSGRFAGGLSHSAEVKHRSRFSGYGLIQLLFVGSNVWSEQPGL